MPSRRSFLRKAALTGVGTAAALLVLPSPPDSLADLEDIEDLADLDDWDPPAIVAGAGDERPGFGAAFEEPLADEDASPIARWQYLSSWGTYEPTSPINVVFPLADREETLADVMAVLEGAGWRRSPEEYVRYAWDRRLERHVPTHASAAETHYGTNGRRHVRCWTFEGVVSMQAHVDSRALPSHAVPSYARAVATVGSLFRAAGWRVAPRAIDLDNAKEPDHDGRATVISPGDRS